MARGHTSGPRVPKAFWPQVNSRARYKGFYGGRDSAKTWSFAMALIAMARLVPSRVLCCCEIQPRSRRA
jgi:hypothetical protein